MSDSAVVDASAPPSVTKVAAAPARSRTGIVRWYSVAKGYGFIEPDDVGASGLSGEIFVHHSAIAGGEELADGDRVRFSILETERGRRAGAVERLS
ncbi:MAG: cold shock domain-containing protein [Acidobacteriota bacterium]